jgi:hypothetical protein
LHADFPEGMTGNEIATRLIPAGERVELGCVGRATRRHPLPVSLPAANLPMLIPLNKAADWQSGRN